MSATNLVTAKFKIDASHLNWEDIKAIRKICSEAAKALPESEKPKVEFDSAKENRKEVGNDALDELLSMSKVFAKIKGWKTTEGIQVPNKGLKTYAEMGFVNMQRFNHLMAKYSNVLVCFSKTMVRITPRQFLDRLAYVCDMEDAKFASLQRARK